MTEHASARHSLADEQQSLLKKVYDLGLQRKCDIGMMLTFLDVDPDDSVLSEILSERISEEEILNVIDPNPFRATAPCENLPGSILIGKVRESEALYLTTPEKLTNHMLVWGRSGGGKTNLVLLILVQLLEQRL